MKHKVVALRAVHLKWTSEEDLPDGCICVMFCFESKKTARAYFGNDTHLVRIYDRDEDEK